MPSHLPSALLLLGSLATIPLLQAQQPPPIPKIDGYVSRMESQTRFEVDGRLVETTDKTGHSCLAPANGEQILSFNTIETGEHVLVFGKYDRKQALVRARVLCRVAWPVQKVSGAALLEKLKGQRLLVDGRLLEITTRSAVTAEAPRHGLADAEAGDWVRYKAEAQPDGHYLVEALAVAANTISGREQKLLNKDFLDFTAPDATTGRPGQVKFAHLARRYKLPADEGLTRLQRVGASLVSAWRQTLSAQDPLQIDFRFYSIAGTKGRDCFEFAQGIIFTPVEVAARLTEDSELSAILATCIAGVLEKQAATVAPKVEASNGLLMGGLAAGMFVPGVGLAAYAGTAAYSQHLVTMLREQGDRVGLDLLSDAGISPEVAPRAYARAESKRATPRPDSEASTHVQYLYQVLAERERRGTL